MCPLTGFDEAEIAFTVPTALVAVASESFDADVAFSAQRTWATLLAVAALASSSPERGGRKWGLSGDHTSATLPRLMKAAQASAEEWLAKTAAAFPGFLSARPAAEALAAAQVKRWAENHGEATRASELAWRRLGKAKGSALVTALSTAKRLLSALPTDTVASLTPAWQRALIDATAVLLSLLVAVWLHQRRGYLCCLDMRRELGCSADPGAPCKGFTGSCADLPRYFSLAFPSCLGLRHCPRFPVRDDNGHGVLMALILAGCAAALRAALRWALAAALSVSGKSISELMALWPVGWNPPRGPRRTASKPPTPVPPPPRPPPSPQTEAEQAVCAAAGVQQELIIWALEPDFSSAGAGAGAPATPTSVRVPAGQSLTDRLAPAQLSGRPSSRGSSLPSVRLASRRSSAPSQSSRGASLAVVFAATADTAAPAAPATQRSLGGQSSRPRSRSSAAGLLQQPGAPKPAATQASGDGKKSTSFGRSGRSWTAIGLTRYAAAPASVSGRRLKGLPGQASSRTKSGRAKSGRASLAATIGAGTDGLAAGPKVAPAHERALREDRRRKASLAAAACFMCASWAVITWSIVDGSRAALSLPGWQQQDAVLIHWACGVAMFIAWLAMWHGAALAAAFLRDRSRSRSSAVRWLEKTLDSGVSV